MRPCASSNDLNHSCVAEQSKFHRLQVIWTLYCWLCFTREKGKHFVRFHFDRNARAMWKFLVLCQSTLALLLKSLFFSQSKNQKAIRAWVCQSAKSSSLSHLLLPSLSLSSRTQTENHLCASWNGWLENRQMLHTNSQPNNTGFTQNARVVGRICAFRR